MFLVEPMEKDPNAEGEQRQIFVCGERNMLGCNALDDSGVPQKVSIPRLEEDSSLRIKFIYSANEKCIVVDTGFGMTLWGRNFDGFIQREPITFCVFRYNIKRIAVGVKHGLAIDENKRLYVWGDGTYGEMGHDPDEKCAESEEPIRQPYFEEKKVEIHSISAGYRHSIIVDTEGKMYSFGDNSQGQVASMESRLHHPSIIDADFKALAVFSGLSHNIVKTKDGRIFRWGGENKLNSSSSRSHNMLHYMYEFKGKRTSNIQTAHENTVIISHLKVFKESMPSM